MLIIVMWLYYNDSYLKYFMFDQHQTFYVILDRAFNQFLIIISILMCVCVGGGVGHVGVGVCVVCVWVVCVVCVCAVCVMCVYGVWVVCVCGVCVVCVWSVCVWGGCVRACVCVCVCVCVCNLGLPVYFAQRLGCILVIQNL